MAAAVARILCRACQKWTGNAISSNIPYIVVETGNQKLKPGCDSAVAFSIFSLLIHMTELGLLRKWREEIIQGGKGVLSSESSGERASRRDSVCVLHPEEENPVLQWKR